MDELIISFWKKDTGNLLSHRQGLTEEQISFLQKLKPGDRLILWKSREPLKETDCHYRLKKFIPTGD